MEHAQNGLAGWRLSGRVADWFGAAAGGLCAFMEHAQNGLARWRLSGLVADWFGAAAAGLCAFQELAQNGLSVRRAAVPFAVLEGEEQMVQ
jgi:hypothetical protein